MSRLVLGPIFGNHEVGPSHARNIWKYIELSGLVLFVIKHVGTGALESLSWLRVALPPL